MQLVDSAYSTFTTQELERLAAYRAAVVAGFYTDWDGSAETTDTELPSVDDLTDADAVEAFAGEPPYWQEWQDKFDYLYVMYAADDFTNPAPDVLTLLYSGDRFRLYKIRKSSP